MFRLLKSKRPIEAPAEIGGVRVKPSHRARRMTLRLDMKQGDIILTWPRGATESSALRFIELNRDWIEQRRQKLPPPREFVEGEVISIHGEKYKIIRKDGRGTAQLYHPAEGRGLASASARHMTHKGTLARADQTPPTYALHTKYAGGVADSEALVPIGQLIIHSRPEHLSRRIKDFLKEKAREVIEEVAAEKLSDINKKSVGIRIIDPKTRWGSCGPDGQMMFSWRLILAPPNVLDYIVAHEVAHRIHMNHSRKFWALCASLTADAGVAKKWLKTHGNALMAYK